MSFGFKISYQLAEQIYDIPLNSGDNIEKLLQAFSSEQI